MLSLMHPAVQREPQGRIVPFRDYATYFEARSMAMGRCSSLPGNVLHDEYLSTPKWRLFGKFYPAWADEILVYPESGKSFRLGKDVFDRESGLILPAKYIPKEGYGYCKGLFIEPADIIHDGAWHLVIPKSVKVVYNFIQENGQGGKMDPETGIPTTVPARARFEKRYLSRKSGTGVVPIARYAFGHNVSEFHVFAQSAPSEQLGVFSVH